MITHLIVIIPLLKYADGIRQQTANVINYAASLHDIELGELQQQLLDTNIYEVDCRLGVLSRALNTQHFSYAKTLMLDGITFI